MNTIVTVTGPCAAGDFGPALVHEHLLVDFIGADKITRDRFDESHAFEKMLPYLVEIREQGFRSFVECTPMYLGRSPVLLKRLSEASGIQILTNTGQYAAGERKGESEPFLPRYAFELSAEALAGGWLKEWYEGIEGTGIRPGFIKIGVNPGPLRSISKKIVRAAAVTSRHSGLAVACHTGKGIAALEVMQVLESEKVSPERFIFVHAQSEESIDLQVQCAQRGCWMEYDGIGPESAQRHLALVREMLDRGFEDQILISQDAGWYRPGEPQGDQVRGYTFLKEEFVPMMTGAGISQTTVGHLLIRNPRNAFTIRQ